MERRLLRALQDVGEPWWVGKAEYTVPACVLVQGHKHERGRHLRGLELRRTDDSDALRKHDLVGGLGVEVAGAHEAGLGGVGVDPAEDEQVVLDAVVEHGALVLRLAGVRRAALLGDQQAADEQRVVNRRPAQDPAHLEASPRVVRRDRQEPRAQRFREEYGPHRLSVF